MRTMKWAMIAAVVVVSMLFLTALGLLFTVSRNYEPINYYKVTVVETKACTLDPVNVRVVAEVEPPVEAVQVNPSWVRLDEEGFYEEPVAEFTGEQLPVKINRVSPLTHIAPNEPGTWKLTESLVAEGKQGGITRTQDYYTEDITPLKVVECKH